MRILEGKKRRYSFQTFERFANKHKDEFKAQIVEGEAETPWVVFQKRE